MQVVCQLRFPPILRIESQPPADFQEYIRGTFPLFQRVQGMANQQVPPEFLRIAGLSEASVTYHFRTEDELNTLALTSNSISLTCDKYERWEQFRDLIGRAIKNFEEIYKPSSYTRIGLRYINVVSRDAINLQERPWSALIRGELLGELVDPLWEQRTFEARSQIRLRMSHDSGAIFLQHGIGSVDGSQETVYVIDFDFYKEAKTEVGSGLAVLEKFHDRSGRAFRWCITDELHQALGPKQPDD